jgi:hypothetical protein
MKLMTCFHVNNIFLDCFALPSKYIIRLNTTVPVRWSSTESLLPIDTFQIRRVPRLASTKSALPAPIPGHGTPRRRHIEWRIRSRSPLMQPILGVARPETRKVCPWHRPCGRPISRSRRRRAGEMMRVCRCRADAARVVEAGEGRGRAAPGDRASSGRPRLRAVQHAQIERGSLDRHVKPEARIAGLACPDSPSRWSRRSWPACHALPTRIDRSKIIITI